MNDATKICQYIEGTKCRNTITGNTFICSGKLNVDPDKDGLFDPDNGNYIYMVEGYYWAEIIIEPNL